MKTLYSTGGHGRRRLTTPGFEESVPQPPDPPIYQVMLHQWASDGRTLPGRRDPEWNRLTAAPAWADRTSRVSGIPAPEGDGR